MPLPTRISANDAMEKVPRVNARDIKTPLGEVVFNVCDMHIANNAVLQYTISMPETRETARFPHPITLTLHMTPEVFALVLFDVDAATELNNKIHVLSQNGAVFMLKLAKVVRVENPDITPFVDILIADPLPLELGERPEDTWLPEKAAVMPTIEEAFSHADGIAEFEAAYVWHKAYVFRSHGGAPLPLDLEDTREILLEKRTLAEGGFSMKEAVGRVGAIRAKLAAFPMLRNVDKIRVRPNRPAGTLARLLDAVSAVSAI